MTALPARRRQARWTGGVLLVLALVVSVLIHHSVAHAPFMASGHSAMAPMAAADMSSPVSPAVTDAAGHGAEAVQSTDAGSSCAGDQMCVAPGVAKTPNLSHPALATQADQPLASPGVLPASGHDIAAAPPPGAPTVLRL
jgi:hypothetical protein